MAWFKGKSVDNFNNSVNTNLDEPPQLPELPRLPPLQSSDFEYSRERMQPLPSLPANPMGNKFSQNMIKEAVNENEEEFEQVPQQPVYRQQEFQQQPIRTSVVRETSEREDIPYEFKEAAKRVKKLEPIFVRLDKFETSLENFEAIKQKVSEIKILLRDIKEKKAQEEQQLAKWDAELQSLKNQIDKIDADLFSKIE